MSSLWFTLFAFIGPYGTFLCVRNLSSRLMFQLHYVHYKEYHCIPRRFYSHPRFHTDYNRDLASGPAEG